MSGYKNRIIDKYIYTFYIILYNVFNKAKRKYWKKLYDPITILSVYSTCFL